MEGACSFEEVGMYGSDGCQVTERLPCCEDIENISRKQQTCLFGMPRSKSIYEKKLNIRSPLQSLRLNSPLHNGQINCASFPLTSRGAATAMPKDVHELINNISTTPNSAPELLSKSQISLEEDVIAPGSEISRYRSRFSPSLLAKLELQRPPKIFTNFKRSVEPFEPVNVDDIAQFRSRKCGNPGGPTNMGTRELNSPNFQFGGVITMNAVSGHTSKGLCTIEDEEVLNIQMRLQETEKETTSETVHGVWNPRASQEEQVESARNAVAAWKNALVEAAWCRILTAAGVAHASASLELQQAEEKASDALTVAAAVGVRLDYTPSSDLASSVTSAGPTTEHSITASLERAVDVDKDVAQALTTALERVATNTTDTHMAQRLNKTQSTLVTLDGIEEEEATNSPEAAGPPLVETMHARVKCLRPEQCNSLATLVATRGLHALMHEQHLQRHVVTKASVAGVVTNFLSANHAHKPKMQSPIYASTNHTGSKNLEASSLSHVRDVHRNETATKSFMKFKMTRLEQAKAASIRHHKLAAMVATTPTTLLEKKKSSPDDNNLQLGPVGFFDTLLEKKKSTPDDNNVQLGPVGFFDTVRINSPSPTASCGISSSEPSKEDDRQKGSPSPFQQAATYRGSPSPLETNDEDYVSPSRLVNERGLIPRSWQPDFRLGSPILVSHDPPIETPVEGQDNSPDHTTSPNQATDTNSLADSLTPSRQTMEKHVSFQAKTGFEQPRMGRLESGKPRIKYHGAGGGLDEAIFKHKSRLNKNIDGLENVVTAYPFPKKFSNPDEGGSVGTKSVHETKHRSKSELKKGQSSPPTLEIPDLQTTSDDLYNDVNPRDHLIKADYEEEESTKIFANHSLRSPKSHSISVDGDNLGLEVGDQLTPETNVEPGLANIGIKKLSRLEKEKELAAAAIAVGQDPWQRGKSSFRSSKKDDSWGGVSLGGTLKRHQSKLQQEQAACQRAEAISQVEKRKEQGSLMGRVVNSPPS